MHEQMNDGEGNKTVLLTVGLTFLKTLNGSHRLITKKGVLGTTANI